jgi:hypothetical protein
MTTPIQTRKCLWSLLCAVAVITEFPASPHLLYGSQATVQAVTEAEAVRLAGAVWAGLERTGDIRKLNRDEFNPTPFRAPCEFLFLIEEPLCAELSQDEKQEYVVSSVNITWQMFEHQMALPNPFFFQTGHAAKFDPADLFPEEVRFLVPPTEAKERTNAEDFHRRLIAQHELEKALAEHRLKHNHVNQPFYRNNLKLLTDKLNPRTTEGRITRLAEIDNTISSDVYSYVYFPFVFFLTKSQGVPRIVWLRTMTDDDYTGDNADPTASANKGALSSAAQNQGPPPGELAPRPDELPTRSRPGGSAANLSGTAAILYPSDGSTIASSGGRLAIPVTGIYSATFQFEVRATRPIEAVAELAIPGSNLSGCASPAVKVRHETTYHPGPPTRAIGTLQVMDVMARNGITPCGVVQGELKDPQIAAWINSMPLPNGPVTGDGLGLFIFDKVLNPASEGASREPNRLSFPIRDLLVSPSLTGPPISVWKVFSPGVYSVRLVVNVGGITAATATSTFTVK